eukprot:766813-Hanusia_phi.AAC.1
MSAINTRAKKLSKVELYFYEELWASGGIELANEWLSSNKKRTSGSSGNSSPFMSNSRPRSRADSFGSANGALSLPRSESEPDKFVMKEQARRNKDEGLVELLSGGKKEDLSYAEMEKRAGSRAGLMYTDAAHLLHEEGER